MDYLNYNEILNYLYTFDVRLGGDSSAFSDPQRWWDRPLPGHPLYIELDLVNATYPHVFQAPGLDFQIWVCHRVPVQQDLF